jgi:hypothetical protein
MVVEATSEQGTEVTYTVSAEDNVDGTATLEEDGTTHTQDDVGGDITITCELSSGSSSSCSIYFFWSVGTLTFATRRRKSFIA